MNSLDVVTNEFLFREIVDFMPGLTKGEFCNKYPITATYKKFTTLYLLPIWNKYKPNDKIWDDIMDISAERGDLESIIWLHKNRKEGCTTKAMDYAAMQGHMHIVIWLHDNRKEGCTTDAMDYAAMKGNLILARWLYKYRTEGCTSNAVFFAHVYRHQRMAKWLKNHFIAHGSTDQMIKMSVKTLLSL